MDIYLVRHGEAKNASEDPERGITDKGKQEVENVAKALKKRGISVQHIFCSPKKRAKETAEIIGNHLGISEITEKDTLKPNDPIEPWVDEILGLEKNIMLVGHLPFLSMLASHLLSIKELEVPVFLPATCMALEKADSSLEVKLAWLLYPKEALEEI